MRAQGRGVIASLSSIVAIAGMPPRNVYHAVKSGVSMLTRSLTCDWAQYGMRVDAIAPGLSRNAGRPAVGA